MAALRSAAILLGTALALASPTPGLAARPDETRSLQGDTRAWTDQPALRRVWERLRAACRDGCAKADAAAFEREALGEMVTMAPALGLTPARMREHVQAVPRQMLSIGAEDPTILSDYGRFITALVGPA